MLVLAAVPSFAYTGENGIMGQLQFCGSYGQNSESESYRSDLASRLEDSGYTVTKNTGSPAAMAGGLYNIRWMKNSLGLGLSTGLMMNTGVGRIRYYQSSNPPSGLKPQASYTIYSFMLPQSLMLFFSKNISNVSSLTAAAGPEACLFITHRALKTVNENQYGTFRLPGKKTEKEIAPGAFVFIGYSQSLTRTMSFDAGVSVHLLRCSSGIKTIPALFVGATERMRGY